MRENTPPEVTLNTANESEPVSIADRLDRVELLLQKPRDYFHQFGRPIDADFREGVLPVLNAIELLTAEVRDLRDKI